MIGEWLIYGFKIRPLVTTSALSKGARGLNVPATDHCIMSWWTSFFEALWLQPLMEYYERFGLELTTFFHPHW
jgi:hypothetical protein